MQLLNIGMYIHCVKSKKIHRRFLKTEVQDTGKHLLTHAPPLAFPLVGTSDPHSYLEEKMRNRNEKNQ